MQDSKAGVLSFHVPYSERDADALLCLVKLQIDGNFVKTISLYSWLTDASGRFAAAKHLKSKRYPDCGRGQYLDFVDRKTYCTVTNRTDE